MIEKERNAQKQNIRMSTSPFLNKRGTVVPGQKGAPGISKKGLEVRNLSKAERIELKAQRDKLKFQRFINRKKKEVQEFFKRKKEDDDLLKNIEKDKDFLKVKEQVVRESGENVDLVPYRLTQRASEVAIKAKDFLKDKTNNGKNPITDAISKEYNLMISREITPLIKSLKGLKGIFKKIPKNDILARESTKIRIDDTKKAIKILEKARDFILEKLQSKFSRDISSNNLEPPSSSIASLPKSNIFSDSLLENNNIDPGFASPPSNIALADIAPRGNIFLINQQQGDTNVNVIEDRGNLTMKGGNVDPYSTMTKYAEFTASLTA